MNSCEQQPGACAHQIRRAQVVLRVGQRVCAWCAGGVFACTGGASCVYTCDPDGACGASGATLEAPGACTHVYSV